MGLVRDGGAESAPGSSEAAAFEIASFNEPDVQRLCEVMKEMALPGDFAPTRREFCARAGVTDTAYLKRFETYTAFVRHCGLKPSAARRTARARSRVLATRSAARPKMARRTLAISSEGAYGERLEGCWMAHAPLNELGVVMLFGMLASELGFIVEIVRPGYPDCEAKRLYPDNRWRRVRIEFEYASSRFDHDANGCDLVVCWIDDSRKCPVEVLELRKVMKERKNRKTENAESSDVDGA